MIKPSQPVFWRVLGLVLVTLATIAAHRVMAAVDAPVSPKAQPGVAQLLNFLNSISGRYVLSGQQEIDWEPARKNEDFDYILKITDETPAVRGFDYLQYLYSASARAQQDVTTRAIAWGRGGGIVTCCCHFYVDIGSPAGNPQYFAANVNSGTPGTTFDIRQAVIPGTLENTEILTKLDLLAAELEKLRDAGVVVIWRPFHEAGSTSFWWSAYGPTPYKQLWRMMFDRFTNTHGLNNLIWMFAPHATDASTLQNWYPGDDVVDMIGYDSFTDSTTAAAHPDYSTDYQQLVSFKAGRKVLVLSRDSALPDIDAMLANGGGWAFFRTDWGYDDNLVGDGQTYNTTAFLNTVYHHAKVITRANLASFYVPDAWAITAQPQPQQIVAGAPLTLSVTVNGPAPLTYQWYKDGTALSSATSATYAVAAAASADAGTYRVTVTGSVGTLTSDPAKVVVANSDTGVLVNLSVLAPAGTSEQVLIIGFVMSGSDNPKPMLLRGMGPSLAAQGVSNFLADPTLTLNVTPSLTNDDWGNNAATSVNTFNATFARLGATPPASVTGKDAALLVSLSSGLYTATVAGTNNTTGEALAEIYDGASGTGARLVNESARGQVSSSAGIAAGFVIGGDSRTVLIRAVGGLALEHQGVNAPLPNPTLTLYRLENGSSTIIGANDDWGNGAISVFTLKSTFAHVGAFDLDAWSHDAVLLVTLPPGVYSAWVNTADGNPGVALVELYEVR